jgi:GTP-binding protein
MDSGALEQERGITILSKVTSFYYKDHKINIVDTPGHADFGGEVERALALVDGALLVVDASEGPMAQTKFVLSKALKRGLKPLVVFNKVDRPTANIEKADSRLLDLFANLGASDEQLEYQAYFASAKQGWAVKDMSEPRDNGMSVLLDAILNHVPPPKVMQNVAKPFTMLVSQTDTTNPFFGRCAIGLVQSGKLTTNDRLKVLDSNRNVLDTGKALKLFNRRGIEQVIILIY